MTKRNKAIFAVVAGTMSIYLILNIYISFPTFDQRLAAKLKRNVRLQASVKFIIKCAKAGNHKRLLVLDHGDQERAAMLQFIPWPVYEIGVTSNANVFGVCMVMDPNGTGGFCVYEGSSSELSASSTRTIVSSNVFVFQ